MAEVNPLKLVNIEFIAVNTSSLVALLSILVIIAPIL